MFYVAEPKEHMADKGYMELGLGLGLVKEEICRRSNYRHAFVDERLVSVRFEMSGGRAAVNFVVACGPTECSGATEMKRLFWDQLRELVKLVSNEDYLIVLTDGNARTAQHDEMGSKDDRKVIGAYERDVLNDHRKKLSEIRYQQRARELEYPLEPTKSDSDHNIVHAPVKLDGRLSLNRPRRMRKRSQTIGDH